jgi:Na+/H+ antiporter NhaC
MFDWLVVLPPIFVLIIAYFTHNILLSIIIGVVSAALIATQGAPLPAGMLIYSYAWQEVFDPKHAFLFMIGFAFLLGAIITLMNYTGGACALGRVITKKLKTARDTQTASLLFSFFVCIDDYLSSLTVGCVMQPLTDRFRIPRTKLAFLINTMASPLVVLIPISSWVGIIVKGLGLSGLTLEMAHTVHEHVHFPGGVMDMGQRVIVHADPFYTYLNAVPFFFYSFIVMAGTWFIVRRTISYGAMKKQEIIAQETGNLYGGQAPRFCPSAITPHDKNYLSDFFVPIISLIVCTLVGLPYTGGYYLFGGTHGLLESFRFADIYPVLFFAGSVSFVASSLLAVLRRHITISLVPILLGKGVKLMYQSAIIIFCALIFGDLLNEALFTGNYLATLILPYISVHWIPLITFIMTSIIALGTGSSWGTILIMCPISTQMAAALTGLSYPTTLANIYILLPTIGAVISGSIAGAQLSPIADPVTVSSTSAGCYQIDHVRTQIPYILPSIIGSCVAFTAAGFLKINSPTITALICLAIGLMTSFILLYGINNWANRTNQEKTNNITTR